MTVCLISMINYTQLCGVTSRIVHRVADRSRRKWRSRRPWIPEESTRTSDSPLSPRLADSSLDSRRGRRRDFLSLEEASPSCGEPLNRGKHSAGEFSTIPPRSSAPSFDPPHPPFAALISWQIGVGNSDRSAILSAANTSRIDLRKNSRGWLRALLVLRG